MQVQSAEIMQYKAWVVRINQYCELFAAELSKELNTNYKDTSLGWVGATLLNQAMSQKLRQLRNDKKVVIEESIEFVKSLASPSVAILPAINKHLATCGKPGRNHNLSAEMGVHEMNRISDLAIDITNRVSLPGIDTMDMAIAWFAAGVSAFVQHWESPIEQCGPKLVDFITSTAFESVTTDKPVSVRVQGLK